MYPNTSYYDQPHPNGLTEDWGLIDYDKAWEQQKTYVEERIRKERPDTLVFNTHPAVYTIGRRKDAAQHILWQKDTLQSTGIQVIETNRGGDVTYHGPGQLVGYPIIDLSDQKDLHLYLRNVEEVLIRTVAHFGLLCGRKEGMTGIWIENRKLAAIGIAVKQWITYHGFALNIDPDMSHYSGIVPCGITDGTVTSLSMELGYSPDPDMVKHLLEVEFWGIFSNYASPWSDQNQSG